MKKFLKLLILTISILIVSVPVFASSYDTRFFDDYYLGNLYDNEIANGISSNSIRLQLNGDVIDFSDANGNKVEPQIINGRTMVPMRKIFEVLGADVQWIQETRTIKATTDELEISLQIDNELATIKSKKGDFLRETKLDAVPTIVDGRTLVPVRFIAESLDKKVGWDTYNRAVIIIDTDFIEDSLKEKTPNFYEYLTNDYETITSYDMSVDLGGKIKFESDSDKSQNTSLNINGSMDLKLSETAMAMGMKLNFTGRGILLEEIKNEKLENIEVEFIFDIENATIYISSPLIEGYENNWIKYEMDEEEAKELNELLEMAKEQSANTDVIQVLVDTLVSEDYMTLSTYSDLESILQVVTAIMGDQNFKVKVADDYKTYTFKLDLSDYLSDYLYGFSETAEPVKCEFNVESIIEDNVEKKATAGFVFEMEQGGEFISIEVEAEGELEAYNEDVSIKIPSGKNVIDMEDVEFITGAGAVDAPGQAMFSGFCQEMGSIQERMDVAVTSSKGQEIVKGNPRANSQLYNFIARGGYNVLTLDEVGDSKWLIQKDADSIPCTMIDPTYAEDVLGMELPIRYVETYKGTSQKVSYFVTPKGEVFCWPPYIYGGKSYVSYDVTVKDENGKEMPGTDATKAKEVTLYFEDTKETVIVSNNDNDEPTIYTPGMGNAEGIGVWYPGGKAKENVSFGIDFSKYDNRIY